MKKEAERVAGINDKIILLIIFIVSIVSLYFYYGKDIEGPFIFNDELTYFGLSRNLVLNHNYSGHTQYNPLYPILMSFAFFHGNTVTAYNVIRFINTVLFSLNVIPVYYICKHIFAKHVYWICIPALFVFFPLKSMVNLVWAEPLFYLLFNFCMLLYLIHIQKKSNRTALVLGLGLGLLFLTKQSGIVLIIAVFLGIIYEIVFVDKKSIKSHIFVLIGITIVSLPWIIRNLNVPGAGALGYESEVQRFFGNFSKVISLVQAAMYQLSYVFLSTFFLVSVLFIALIVQIIKHRDRKNDFAYNSFFILIAFYILGIVALTAMHRITGAMEEFADKELAFGRYLAIGLIYIWIGALYYFEEHLEKMKTYRLIVGIFLVILGVATVYTAIRSSTYSYGYLNNFDLSYLNDFINGFGVMYYDKNVNSGENAVLIVSCAFSAIVVAFFAVPIRIKKIIFIILGIFVAYTGFRSQEYIRKLSNNTKYINDVCKFIVKEEVNVDHVAWDVGTDDLSNIDKFAQLWFNKSLGEIDVLNLKRNIYIDFSTVDGEIDGDAIALRAPWVGESTYNSEYNSFGYWSGGIGQIDSAAKSGIKKNEMDDLNYGWNNDTIYFELNEGKYRVRVYGDYTPLAEKGVHVDFDTYVNGEYVFSCVLNSNDTKFTKEIIVENEQNILEINFVPQNECFWAVNAMEIEQISGNKGVESVGYIISKKDLNYPIIHENEGYTLYKID